MTLKDIAQEAGVSISTVSRVINQSSKSPARREVQERIWEIVRRTGYTPNVMARDLKRGVSSTEETLSRSIACLFARTSDGVTDSFFSPLARSIEKEAFQHNYLLKYTFTAFDINHPSTYRLISDHNVDGVAVLGRCDQPLLKFLKQHFKCVVYTGLNILDAKYDQVVCDGQAASLSAMEYLFSLGHTRIAYVGETRSENRYQGYCAALASHRLPVKREYIANVALSSEGGYQGAHKLLSRHRDISAIFCPNDITAIGAIRAVKEHGLSIPSDISIISIDDIDMAQYVSPMLTTVHIPVEEMGQMAAKTLMDRIEGGHKLPLKVNLPFYIAHRESCGPCKPQEKGNQYDHHTNT